MSNIRRRSSSISSLNSRASKPISNNHINMVKSNTNSDKKKAFSKPTWDSTTNDLNQLKATQEEIERRKQAHQSKNKDLAKIEVQKKIQSANKSNKQDTNSQAAQLALLKEILFDDERLKGLINFNNNTTKGRMSTDNTLKAVQNFFHGQNDFEDDNCSVITNGKRQAKINMTLAPNVRDLNDSTLPVPNELLNKNSSKLSNRRISNNIKINNINDFDEDFHDEIPVQDENKSSNNLIDEKLKKLKQSNDLEKYKQLLELKNKLIESTIKTASSEVANTKKQYSSACSSSQLDTTELNLNDLEECLRILTSNKKMSKNEDDDDGVNSVISAKNDKTSKINNTHITSYKFFENALSELENKLIDFEKLSGKQTNNYTKNNSNINSANTSTYTLTLIKIISNLTDHIKDTSVELNFEKLKSVELNKQLEVHRKLIDGLTNEVLSIKEQNKKLLNGFINQQAKLEAEMEQIKLLMKNNMSQIPAQYPNQSNRLSAFSTHSQSSLDLNEMNITNQRNAFQHQILHLNNMAGPQSQQQQHQQSLMIPRPISCMSSLNTINLDQPLNTEKRSTADKFSERLNAMLFNQTNSMEPNKSDFRSSFDNLNINRSLSNFNQQVQELSFKNVEAQQKLRQVLLEQKQISLSNNELQQVKLSNEINNNNNNNQNSNISSSSSSHQQQLQNEALEKLQKEKKMLKEQIDMLNRQRESAQFELDTLVNTNNQPKQNSAENSKTNIQNSIMKHLNEIKMSELENNFDLLSTNTPSLSPIRPEKNM